MCLREVEERMANHPDPVSSARTVEWAEYMDGGSRSGSESSSGIDNRRGSFDESEYSRSGLMMSREQSLFPQPVLDSDMIVSPVELQLESVMTRRPSNQSIAVSQISSAMTRKNSNSSEGGSSINSSNTSFEPTPRSEVDTAMPDHSMMLPNQRIAGLAHKGAGARIEKKLRSGKTVGSGPTDLDDPSVYIQKQNVA